MRVLAIDPGYERVGIAILEKQHQKEICIHSECFTTLQETSFNNRLFEIGTHIRDVIKKYSIDALAIEGLFFSKNTKTALQVSEARGVIIFQASDSNIPIFEYTPNQIKVAVTGYGKASKKDMQNMVYKLISLKDKKRKDDEIDAIAIGITFFAIQKTFN